MPVSIPLLKAAWRLGGESEVAVSALVQIQRDISLKAARAQAAEWLSQRPDPAIAAIAGLFAVEAGNLEDAQALLAAGQQLGPDRLGLIESLEFQVTAGLGDEDAMAEMVHRFEQRNDLSPAVAKAVQVYLLMEAMFAERHEESERRAARLWSLEDDPMAATARWVLARVGGRDVGFDEFSARLKLTQPQRLFHEAFGHVAVGELEKARRLWSLLAETDAAAAEAIRLGLEQKEASR
jgi:hypothetical protein